MKKVGLAVLVAFFSYTLVDIMIWQRIFETHRLERLAFLYHSGWYVMLAGELALGALLLFPKWREMLFYVVGLLSLSMCGLEDILYYWLVGRTIPPELPWLNANPWIFVKPVTSTGLIISASTWVVFLVIAFWFWHRRESGVQVRRAPTELRAPAELLDHVVHPAPSNRKVPVRISEPDQE